MQRGPGLYSRIVAVLKVALPLTAVGLLSALFLGQNETGPGGGNLVFSPGDIDALGEGLRITNPVFTGMTEGEDAFRFTAALVVPDAAPPQRAAIEAPAGTLELKDGPVLTLEAARGDLDIPTRRLDLAGTVRIDTSDGYSIHAPRVRLDLTAGTLTAEDAVETVGPAGRIDSGTLSIAPAVSAAAAGAQKGSSDARRFSFGNGVRLVYDPAGPTGNDAK